MVAQAVRKTSAFFFLDLLFHRSNREKSFGFQGKSAGNGHAAEICRHIIGR
jgi:hypothetical protein